LWSYYFDAPETSRSKIPYTLEPVPTVPIIFKFFKVISVAPFVALPIISMLLEVVEILVLIIVKPFWSFNKPSIVTLSARF
jgi:hypothetical protein